jgi:quinoprotein relay system zinc metallohydrolase 2
MRVWAVVTALLAALFPAPARAVEPLPVVEIAPGVLVHQGAYEDFTPENAGGIANIGFVIGGSAVAVIDSGGSAQEGERLLATVRQRTSLPIAYVINTHLHPDHVLGDVAFRGDGTRFVGSAKLPQHLAEAGPVYLDNMRRLLGPAFAGTELVLPDLVIGDRMELDLGGRKLDLRTWPTAHTDTDLTVTDEATRTLFAGDLVFLERIPVIDGSLNGWIAVLDQLARIDAARVVPGHGPPSAPWPQALEPERAYLTGLREEVRQELARNRTVAEAVREVPVPAGQHWLLAEQNHPRNVTASFTELEWE